MQTLGLAKFSTVLCAVVRCELVVCLPEGEGEAQGWRLQVRQVGMELEASAGGLCLPCTCCVILSRWLSLSGPQLADLQRQRVGVNDLWIWTLVLPSL